METIIKISIRNAKSLENSFLMFEKFIDIITAQNMKFFNEFV